MSLKTVFIITAIVAGLFALVTLLIPTTVLSWYGEESSNTLVLMTRLYGAALLAIALITFYLKNSKLTSDVKSVVLALLIFNAVGAIVTIWDQIANYTNNLGWLNVIIFLFFTIALYSVYKKK